MTGGSALGRDSPGSFMGVESQMVPLLVAIMNEFLVTVLMQTGSQVDTYLIIIFFLFLWSVVQNTVDTVSEEIQIRSGNPEASATAMMLPRNEDDGWTGATDSMRDLISKILVLLFFQYTSRLLRNEWAFVGATIVETLLLMVAIVAIFFPAYLWIDRVWKLHARRHNQAVQRLIKLHQTQAPHSHRHGQLPLVRHHHLRRR